MSADESFVADQFIHGYADGHKLLASSTQLGRSAQQLMLAMSDLSGPTVARGFDTYITGYPLRSEGLYVIARTWYAAEMPRPGCVWTQSLAFLAEALVGFDAARGILRAFRRPTKDLDISMYDQPLMMKPAPAPLEILPATREATVQLMVDALFDHDSRAVFLAAESSEQYEELVLRTWTYLWPRLRMNFAFSTGSLSNRDLDGIDFDLQAVPGARAPLIQRRASDSVVIYRNPRHVPAVFSTWAVSVAKDLSLRREDTLAEQLMRQYSDDVPPLRTMVGCMARVLASLSALDSATTASRRAVAEAAHGFPDGNVAQLLKIALFGHPIDRHVMALWLPEPDLLEALLGVEQSRAFEPNGLRIAERASLLWQRSTTVATDLLLRVATTPPRTPLKKAFVEGIAAVITPRQIVELASAKISIVRVLVRHNPKIATAPEVWCLPVERTPLRSLRWHRLDAETRAAIVEAMIASGNPSLPAAAFRASGVEFVAVVLEVIGRRPSTRLPENWASELQRHEGALAAWVESQAPSEIAEPVLLWIVGLMQPDTLAEDASKAWVVRAAKGLRGAKSEGRREVAAAVNLLTAGLKSDHRDGCLLVSASFETVYGALAVGAVSPDLWSRLEGSVPQRRWWWWERDDRPERLRIALAEAFAQKDWPLSCFIDCVSDASTLDEILRTDASAVRRLRRRLKDHLRSAPRSDARIGMFLRVLSKY